MPAPTHFNNRLASKVAIVTGAGSREEGFGTGAATAVLLAGEGAAVAVVDRERDRAEETVRRIEQIGGRSMALVGDVTLEDDCAGITSQTVAAFGAIDILVNNVGVAAAMGKLEQLDMAAWTSVIDTNLKSAVLMAKSVIPQMPGDRGGAIVNIASVAALLAHGGSAYGPSKAALLALTRDLALMYGRRQIRVNAVAPGHIFTPFVSQRMTSEIRTLRRRIAPLGIEGDAWDVARTVLFLASEDARFITGICIPVDGGVTQIAPITAQNLLASEE
jgi:NAD(P)-dependent dehydrogenase (short-subunit alcohol dehydrogenase family)